MRRPNGTGTIIKLPGVRRRPYAVRISGRDKYGYVIQHALSYHETVTQAQAALDTYNRTRATGRAAAPDQLSMTVQQVFEGWSGREYKKLKPASITSHNAAWSKRVSRYATRKMRDVPLDDWQAILDEDEENGLSQSLINNDALLIKALYSYAMERDIVGKDYSKFLDIPTVDAKRAKGSFTNLQMAQLERLAKEGFPWADTVLILCYTGFRITEFLTLTQFNYHQEDGGYLQAGMKTQAGRDRIVPIHPKIRPYLLSWLGNHTDTIFTNGGQPIPSYWYRETAFAAIAEALGAPEATPHWCRHTFATRLHAAQVDEMTTKWLLGHSTKSDITARYTHQTIHVLSTAIAKLA